MRADRLVAILMLLQTRGQVTAGEVASELEVSERTARRDLDALGVAGLPIYSVQGRNGGWRLTGGGKTDLSALTAAEAQALFLVAGPSSAAAPELKSALRKLVRALPEQFRAEAIAASKAIVVDHADWDRRMPVARVPPLLDAVQRAVIAGAEIELGYVARDRAETTRVAHPLGLAAKGSVWYLVADTDAGLRTFRVDRITAVSVTGEPARRPPGFELAEAWRLIADEVEARRLPLSVDARVDADHVWLVRNVLGTRVRIGASGDDGRVALEVRGFSVGSLAGQLAAFGHHIEVLGPAEVREQMANLGAQLVALYDAPTAAGRVRSTDAGGRTHGADCSGSRGAQQGRTGDVGDDRRA